VVRDLSEKFKAHFGIIAQNFKVCLANTQKSEKKNQKKRTITEFKLRLRNPKKRTISENYK